jgi:hypothetical protein
VRVAETQNFPESIVEEFSMARKSGGAKSSGGGRKQTTQPVSKIASRGLRTGKLTPQEIRKVSASALGQDEKKGK